MLNSIENVEKMLVNADRLISTRLAIHTSIIFANTFSIEMRQQGWTVVE